MAKEYDWERQLLPEREWKRRERLREALHSSGPVASAFERVCKAGCNPEWLEEELVRLANSFPFRRARAMLPAVTRRKFGRIIRGLEVTSDRLLEVLNQPGISLVFAKIEEDEDWPVPQEFPKTLRKTANHLRSSLSSPTWRQRRWGNPARFRIPYLIQQVRQSTGRPHYAHMATLIGAAYEREYYSEEDLKMLVSRARRQR